MKTSGNATTDQPIAYAQSGYTYSSKSVGGVYCTAVKIITACNQNERLFNEEGVYWFYVGIP